MRYLFQLTIILVVSLLGEILKYILPFPIPSNVYGLLLMLFCLSTGIVKLRQVEEVAEYFLAIMPVLFVPVCVALMNYVEAMAGDIFGLLLIAVASTLATLCVTMVIAQLLISKKKLREKEEHHE